MSKGKKLTLIYAIMILYAGFSAASYGAGIVIPQKLTNIDGMAFYALVAAEGTLGMMLALPLVGKLCDLFGTKAVSMMGVFLQLVCRIGMIVTGSIVPFMIFQIISNIGLGMYVSAPFALLAEVTGADERPKYYGMLVTFKAIGSLLGPLITGALVDNGFVDLAFAAYVPFIVLSVPFILVFCPNSKTSRTANQKFDLAGILLMVVGVSCIVFWLSLAGKLFEWVSPISIVLLVVGVVSVVALIRVEIKHPNPSVAVGMFRKKRFTTAFLSNMLLSNFSTCMGAYVIVYMQQVMQVSKTVSSTGSMPMTIVQALFGAVLGGYVGKAFAKRFRPIALISLTCIAVGMLIVCFLTPTSPMILIYLASGIGGFGTIVPQSTFANFFQTELSPEEYSGAQGMFSFGSTGGSCIFMAVTGAMLNGGGTYNMIFWLSLVLCVLALIIGVVGLKLPQESERASNTAS